MRLEREGPAPLALAARAALRSLTAQSCLKRSSTAPENQSEAERRSITVPISPGLYGDVNVSRIEKVALGKTITIKGPGILAFDGDRTIKLGNGETAILEVRRDGPWIIETAELMSAAAHSGLFESR
ncbi:MAG: hypothetical protein IIB71_04105 [Proteobacteria bacterium]|nr:hypothetical protein [Pseudomonadota bacterium]